ncbi:hypothetical protein DFH09DRAFT_1379373 [Mycena vulgaris]|nr:hypothetical protein DFH09DRAFT_1379373 [Mycena vulgaris]
MVSTHQPVCSQLTYILNIPPARDALGLRCHRISGSRPRRLRWRGRGSWPRRLRWRGSPTVLRWRRPSSAAGLGNAGWGWSLAAASISHICKHTGERPFTCRCSGQFSRLDNLQQRADKHALRHHHFHDHCLGTASLATPASASGGAGKRGNAATKRTRGGGSAAGVAAMGSPYVLLTPIDTSEPPPPRAPTPAHTDIVPLATTSSPRPPCPMGRFCAPPRPPPHAARDPTPGLVRLGSISQDRGHARHLDAKNPLSGRASTSPSPNPLSGHPWGSVGPELAACAKVQRYRDVYAIQIPATPIGARRPPSDEVGIRVELVEHVSGMFDLSGRERAAGAVWAAGV